MGKKPIKQDKVAMLVAMTPDRDLIPCRIFPNMEVGKARCEQIFQQKGHEDASGRILYDVHILQDNEITEVLFTSFYAGGHGLNTLFLQEVVMDSKIVPFNFE